MRQNSCSQSRPTNSTRDCYITHQAHLRVCYVIYFILFYFRRVDIGTSQKNVAKTIYHIIFHVRRVDDITAKMK